MIGISIPTATFNLANSPLYFKIEISCESIFVKKYSADTLTMLQLSSLANRQAQLLAFRPKRCSIPSSVGRSEERDDRSLRVRFVLFYRSETPIYTLCW